MTSPLLAPIIQTLGESKIRAPKSLTISLSSVQVYISLFFVPLSYSFFWKTSRHKQEYKHRKRKRERGIFMYSYMPTAVIMQICRLCWDTVTTISLTNISGNRLANCTAVIRLWIGNIYILEWARIWNVYGAQESIPRNEFRLPM